MTLLHTSAYVIRQMKSIITTKYARHKLASDGTRFGAGQAIVTPSVIRGELIALYRRLELEGIVENADLFKKYLIVERNASNPNRLDVLFPPDYVNQLRIFAVLNQFRLQYGEQETCRYLFCKGQRPATRIAGEYRIPADVRSA